MAQLRDLVLNGPSRFLGVATYNNDVIFNKDVIFYENLLPATTLTQNLGSNDYWWNTVYAGIVKSNSITTATGAASNSISSGDIQVAGGIGVANTSFFKEKIYSGSTSYYIEGDAISKLNNLELAGTLKVTGASTLAAVTAGTISATSLTTTNTITSGGKLTVKAGGATITAGGLAVSAGGATITGNSTITGTLTITSTIKATQNAASTSTTTGSIQVTGGIAASGTSFFADKIYSGITDYYIEGDATSKLKNLELGGTLKVTGTTTLAALTAANINCTSLTASKNISAGTTIAAGTTITAGTGLIATTGGLNVKAGGAIINGKTTITGDQLLVTLNQESTSTTTGSLVVTGGIGVSGQISAKTIMINNKATMKYDTNNEYVYFVFE